DLDLDVADVDLVVQRDRMRALDPAAVDEGPVGRADVGDDQLAATRVDVEASVVAGDASLREHEIVAGHTADPDLGLVVYALDPRRLALIRDPDSHGRSCGPRGSPGRALAPKPLFGHRHPTSCAGGHVWPGDPRLTL